MLELTPAAGFICAILHLSSCTWADITLAADPDDLAGYTVTLRRAPATWRKRFKDHNEGSRRMEVFLSLAILLVVMAAAVRAALKDDTHEL